jgi:myo-inositol catabolism protein IolS
MSNRTTISRTGLNVFKIGLGAGAVGNQMMYPNVTEETGKQLVKTALDQGINFIDTAYLYGLGRSEELIGEIINKRGGRDRLVISTKASPDIKFVDGIMEIDNSRPALRQAVDDSLARLQTDYLDVYFLHFPNTKTPLAEVAGTLAELKKEGKIKAIGVSNVTFDQLLEFNTDGHLDILQVQYSLLVREAETEIIPYCLDNQISIIPFYPLADGLLAGKYTKNDTFNDISRMNNPLFKGEAFLANLNRVEQLKTFALNKGVETAQVALAWLLTRPGVDIIIPGAKRPDQIETNIRTLDVHLSEDEIHLINEMFIMKP